MSIKIPREQIDERLAHGDLWVTGIWGDYMSPTRRTCLHGAIRYCQPVPGDAYLIEQVSALRGWGVADNDRVESWGEIFARVPSEVTDADLEDTFGPQWVEVVALVRRAATLTTDEAKSLDASWTAAEVAAWEAAWEAAGGAARTAARAATEYAAETAARDAALYAARYAARVTIETTAPAWTAARRAAWAVAWGAVGTAAKALAARHLIGQHGYTQDMYDLLTRPWREVIGPVHPDDAREYGKEADQ